MQKLIKNGDITENYWELINEDHAIEITQLKNALVPLNFWLKNEAQLLNNGKIGIWISGDTALDSLPESVFEAEVIAISFPAFADGRGFSLARQIREHKDFSGDIRAIGAFVPDQMYYLTRCGFSSFVLDDVDDGSINECLNAFSNGYQAAVDEPRPLFRRRN